MEERVLLALNGTLIVLPEGNMAYWAPSNVTFRSLLPSSIRALRGMMAVGTSCLVSDAASCVDSCCTSLHLRATVETRGQGSVGHCCPCCLIFYSLIVIQKENS